MHVVWSDLISAPRRLTAEFGFPEVPDILFYFGNGIVTSVRRAAQAIYIVIVRFI